MAVERDEKVDELMALVDALLDYSCAYSSHQRPGENSLYDRASSALGQITTPARHEVIDGVNRQIDQRPQQRMDRFVDGREVPRDHGALRHLRSAGETIPVPTRDDVMSAFRKVAGGAVVPPSEDDDTTDTVH